jgi:hypothetical protein
MSKRIRHRHQRSRTYYRVLRPDGIYDIVSATQFTANIAAGNLIRDKNDPRLARPRKWLSFKIDERTGELTFHSRRKPAATQHAPASTEAMLRKWLESERTLTADEARRKMRASLPRVDTEGVRLY